MIKRHIVSAAPPPPIGVTYAHASEVDGWLYVTGQLPTDPAAPAAPFADGIEAQTEQHAPKPQDHRRGMRATASPTPSSRASTSAISTATMTGFNRAFYRAFTGEAASVSRTTVGVAKLGRGALVEIDLVLRKQDR